MTLVDRIVARARRTPYFDLPGYMLRYWLVPPYERNPRMIWTNSRPDFTLDGTGPLSFGKRPIAATMQRLGFDARVHVILRSDRERHPHDHPVPYVSIILRNRYREHQFDVQGNLTRIKTYGPGSILFRSAKSLHVLELEDPTQPVTSIFIRCTWPSLRQEWGFVVDGEKIHWREYESQQNAMLP